MTRLNLKAKDWFNKGERIIYNFKKKQLSKEPTNWGASNTFKVFHRIIPSTGNDQSCISMLPGFPDGSFGWARVEQLLIGKNNSQRLYVEYIGQGDSDKPEKYNYGIMERADLVEAMWEYYGIKQTFIVAFDYSSLVVLELLRRQQKNEGGKTQISKVLLINGGLFADAHSHPLMTTPLLKTKFGKMGTRMAQKSHFAFNMMLKDLWSKEYGITKQELNEVFDAITRRNGAVFMSNAAGFVDEHKNQPERWDLLNIYNEMHKEVSFHVVGSEKDQFEPQQIVKAKERLGKFNVDIRLVPGGHMATSEQPELLANMIQEIDG